MPFWHICDMYLADKALVFVMNRLYIVFFVFYFVYMDVLLILFNNHTNFRLVVFASVAWGIAGRRRVGIGCVILS